MDSICERFYRLKKQFDGLTSRKLREQGLRSSGVDGRISRRQRARERQKTSNQGQHLFSFVNGIMEWILSRISVNSETRPEITALVCDESLSENHAICFAENLSTPAYLWSLKNNALQFYATIKAQIVARRQ